MSILLYHPINRILHPYIKILGVSIIIILICAAFIVPGIIEKKASEALRPYVQNEPPEIHFSLWSNSLQLTLKQDTFVMPESDNLLTIDSGRLLIQQPSWIKFWRKNKISIDQITLEAHHLSGQYHKPQKTDSSSRNRPIAIENIKWIVDSVNFQYDNHSMMAGQQNIKLTSILLDSGKIQAVPMPSHIDHPRVRLPKGMEILANHIVLGRDTLTVKDFQVNDTPNKRKRVYFQTTIDNIHLVRENGFSTLNIHDIDHLNVQGMNMQIDDDGDVPPCNGKKPCVKPIMAEFVFQLPIRQSVKASGELTYRFYQNNQLKNLVELERINAEAKYIPGESDSQRVQMNWDVRTVINEDIPVHWTTRFFPNSRFDYHIIAENFPMRALNPMIPTQEKYTLKIDQGQCQKLQVDVEGVARKSTAKFSLDYDDLKLNISRKEQKKWLANLLDAASPVFIRNDHETDEPIVHEVEFEKKRTFFYQMGQHINHGVKETVLVF